MCLTFMDARQHVSALLNCCMHACTQNTAKTVKNSVTVLSAVLSLGKIWLQEPSRFPVLLVSQRTKNPQSGEVQLC